MAVKILKFGASWCGACTRANKYLERVESTLPVKVVGVDVDENEELTIKYNIRSIPTFIAVKPNGDIVDILSGFDKAKFEAFVESVRYK